MPMTSGVASRTGSEIRRSAMNVRVAAEFSGPSTLMEKICRFLKLSAKESCWSCCNSLVESSAAWAQKIRSKGLPRSNCSVCVLPERAGKEKSGAGRGASSQVSTEPEFEMGFAAGGSEEYTEAVGTNFAAAKVASPSTIEMR